jgi:hypothetical protein
LTRGSEFWIVPAVQNIFSYFNGTFKSSAGNSPRHASVWIGRAGCSSVLARAAS